MPWLPMLDEATPAPIDAASAARAKQREAASAVESAAFDRAATFLEGQLAQVDVQWQEGAPHRVVFAVPSASRYLPTGFAQRLVRSAASHASPVHAQVEITLRADEIERSMEHRQWLATAALPALMTLVKPVLRLGVLVNAALLNLLAADAMDYETANGVPRLAGASLLIPLLALAQLVGTACLLFADAVELAPPAIERRWCDRRLAAALRDREHVDAELASNSNSNSRGLEAPSILSSGGDARSGDARSGDARSRRGMDAMADVVASIVQRPWCPPALRHCVGRSWPVRQAGRAIGAAQAVYALLRDGRVRGAADGYPEGAWWASACRLAIGASFAAVEPPLLYGVGVVACGLPALVARPSAPFFLSLQLLLLLASHSESARKAAATLLTPWPQLVAVALLGLSLLYIHAAFAYYLFGETLGGLPCSATEAQETTRATDLDVIRGGLAGCIGASLVGPGLVPWGWSGPSRAPGGGREEPAASAGSIPRLVLDLSCYVSIGVLTLGSGLAVMLEAFEEVRRAESGVSHDGSAGPLAAIDYVLFLLHVRAKRHAGEEPLSALEMSVERRAAALDLSWFPRGVSRNDVWT